jgi:hypothetical protein
VRPGEAFEALVKAEDRWGNPCERFEGELALDAGGAPIEGLPPMVRFRLDVHGRFVRGLDALPRRLGGLAGARA